MGCFSSKSAFPPEDKNGNQGGGANNTAAINERDQLKCTPKGGGGEGGGVTTQDGVEPVAAVTAAAATVGPGAQGGGGGGVMTAPGGVAPPAASLTASLAAPLTTPPAASLTASLAAPMTCDAPGLTCDPSLLTAPVLTRGSPMLLNRLVEGGLPYQLPNYGEGPNSLYDYARKEAQQLQRLGAETHVLVHSRVVTLADNFLKLMMRVGSRTEQQVFGPLDAKRLFVRMISCRPLTFWLPGDKYVLKSQDKGEGGFESIGTDGQRSPLVLENLICYDEMAISAMVNVSSLTPFFNDGRRNNEGRPGPSDVYPFDGIYTACTGSRFEREGAMEFAHMVVTPKQNTPENGYGSRAAPSNRMTELLKLWADFYGLRNFPDWQEAQQRLQDFESLPGCLFDGNIYMQRMRMSIEPFLLNADVQAAKVGKSAYVHAVGLGVGAWALETRVQTDIMLRVYQQVLDEHAFQNVKVIDLSWFDDCNQGLIHHDRIRIRFSRRNPGVPVAADELLVAQYAWDGNAYPGNEYWDGELDNSSDPAAACCSAIALLQNPDLNQQLHDPATIAILPLLAAPVPAPATAPATASAAASALTAAPEAVPEGLMKPSPQLPTPKLDAIQISDPRCPSRKVGVVAFYHPGKGELWDELCCSGFLGNFWNTGPGSIRIRAKNHSDDAEIKEFACAESAFQALKFWERAAAFTNADGEEAYRLKVEYKNSEDRTYAGHGSNWAGMGAVLRAKFPRGSAYAEALLATQDAFLLEHCNVSGRDKEWSDNHLGDGKNWLGLQLMLLRDELQTSSGSLTAGDASGWTEFLGAFDLQTGASRDKAVEAAWRTAVKSAADSTNAAFPDRLICKRLGCNKPPFEGKIGGCCGKTCRELVAKGAAIQPWL